MRRGLVGIPQSAGCRRSRCAIQDDDGSGSPSLGADTCANHHKALMIGAMCASSLLAGAASDDATGAGDGRCVRGEYWRRNPGKRCPDDALLITVISGPSATGSQEI